MIIQAISKPPFINLGRNAQSLEVGIDELINIWQTEIYNTTAYKPSVISLGATVVLTGLERSIISFDNAGAYTIQLQVSRNDRNLDLLSNIITVTAFLSFKFYKSANTQYLQFITQ